MTNRDRDISLRVLYSPIDSSCWMIWIDSLSLFFFLLRIYISPLWPELPSYSWQAPINLLLVVYESQPAWLLPACGNLSVLLYFFSVYVTSSSCTFIWKREEWVNGVRLFFYLCWPRDPSIFFCVWGEIWKGAAAAPPAAPDDMNGSTLDHDRSSQSWVSGYGRLNIQQ